MGRDSHLSDDIDLIREFEELKLKQQLLISSLQNKKKLDKDKILLEISSKLDFIVEIFQKSNEEESSEGPSTEEMLKSLVEKIEGLEKKIEEKFSEVHEKIEDTSNAEETKVEDSQNIPSETSESKIKEEPKEKPSKEEDKKENKDKVVSDSEPPKPSFSVDSSETKPMKTSNPSDKDTSEPELVAAGQEVKKKRKWF